MKLTKLKQSIFAAIAAIAMTASTSGFAEELPKTKFTVVGTWASLSLFKKLERPFWEETIPEKSNGALKVKLQPFTEMGLKGGEVFRLMRSGVIDMGSTVLSYIGGEIPEAEAIDIAGITRDINQAHKISDSYKPVLAKVFQERYGVKLLAIVPFHGQVIYCRDPISSLDDLKGRKIRTYGKSMGDMIAAVGGSPVGMASGEVVPALQKGVVDCAITGALSGNLSKWHQAANYLYPLPVSWAITFVAANGKFWNNLDPKVQTFLTNELSVWEDKAWKSGASETQDGISCNTGGTCKDGNSANMKLTPVQSGDLDKLKEIMINVVVPKWAERCGTECAKEWNQTVGKVVSVTAPTK